MEMDLNEIISARAQLVWKHQETQALREGRNFTLSDVARRVAKHWPDAERKDGTLAKYTPEELEELKVKHVRKTLERLFGISKEKGRGVARWQLEQIEAFAAGMEVPLASLFGFEVRAENISELDFGVVFGQFLGRSAIPPNTIRSLRDQLKDAISEPGLLELLMSIQEAILTAPDKHDAAVRVQHILAASKDRFFGRKKSPRKRPTRKSG